MTPIDKTLDWNLVKTQLGPMLSKIDIDGFFEDSNFTKCTPHAIMRILNNQDILLSGKNVVIIGRSNVGKPLINLLLDKDATVTICHRKTIGLTTHLKNADIIISAAGFPNLITPEMLNPTTIIIDVGVNQDANGNWMGDVANDCELINSNIVGIKSGIGKITRLVLLENLFQVSSS